MRPAFKLTVTDTHNNVLTKLCNIEIIYVKVIYMTKIIVLSTKIKYRSIHHIFNVIVL